ncbi:hypothetical protein MYXO_03610 [Myxococcaceae bacterium]|jgi:TorA maturation chaperone TorD|nr:hypothetical protein MYXO_03610 [Myxococcaceae bacterium]
MDRGDARESKVREGLERAQGWRAIARGFGAPQAPDAIRDDLDSLRSRTRGELAEALTSALAVLAESPPDELEAAHERLFGGGGAVPARESAWADARAVAPTELADVRGFLRAFGLEEKGEVADHITTECELASVLALKEAWAEAQGWEEEAAVARDAYRVFVEDHLLRWAPRFGGRVAASGLSEFHAAVARILVGFLDGERIRLGLEPALGVAAGPAPRLSEEMACGGRSRAGDEGA